VTGVSERWLQNYVNQKYEEIPKEIKIKKKKAIDWLLNVMKCDLLLEIKRINNGFGWQ
jgi:hypothetical protein